MTRFPPFNLAIKPFYVPDGSDLTRLASQKSSKGVLKKKPHHLPGGIGAKRIGVATHGAASRPGMTCSMHDPSFEKRLLLFREPACPRVGAATVHLTIDGR